MTRQKNQFSPTPKQIEELSHLVDKYKNNEDFYNSVKNNYNEHSCRDEFLNPFLKIMGWDIENSKGLAPQFREIIAENYSTESERPDYTMVVRGTSKLFLEAKKPSVKVRLNEAPAIQARKYGWNANHIISVLSNFEDLLIYDTTVMPLEGDKPAVALYRAFHYTEYIDNFEEIASIISRQSLYSGYFDNTFTKEILSSTSTKTRIGGAFLETINGWRVKIAESLVANDAKYLNEELLNDATQDLINQVVFLRICEDRNLPAFRELSTLAEAEDFRDQAINLLRETDKSYNSGLFDQDSAIMDLSENVLRRIIEDLYYPKGSYMFDIIEPALFGQIYELFLAEHIVVDEDGSVALAPKREYKDRSVVSTPVEIVKYICDTALSFACDGKTPTEVKNLRIADIACGSGIFLLEAFEYLEDYCIGWYMEHDIERLIEVGDGVYKLPFNEKREIIENCLYGVDIDVHAVAVSKFALLVKLIEEENTATVYGTSPILPNLDRNIVLGNSLVTPSDARSIGMGQDDIESVVPFDWNEINSGRPFDVILGNPPYVKTEDMHALLPESEFGVYKKKYHSAYKQFDKYYLFIEQALEVVVGDGFVCLLVPNKFYKTASAEKLRELLSDQHAVCLLYDFGDTQLFDERITYSSILGLQKTNLDWTTFTRVVSLPELWDENGGSSVTLSSNTLGASPWTLTTDKAFLKWFTKFEEYSVPITDHIIPFTGIQTSAETKATYWFKDSAEDTEVISQDKESITFSRDGEWKIERKILRRYFKPDKHGSNSYSDLSCDKWIIFPYDEDGILIPMKTMEEEYPGAWAYLNSRKEELWPKNLPGNGKRDVPNATEDTWYQYGRHQALSVFTGQEKIIVGILSSEPLYFIDRNDWLIASGDTAGYCAIRMQPDSPYSLEFIQAWLSNSHTEEILRVYGGDFMNGFKPRGRSLLSRLPFIELDLNNPKALERHNKVTQLSQSVQEYNERLRNIPSHKEKTILERSKKDAIQEISNLIDSIYLLECKDEIKRT